ncbi:MAG: hypothetical protein EPN73_23465 [Paraburkholderia sp.]|nr:hypothetical protein [Paraburkholderia sp.]TAL92933.1 MAG: hypothetical protein EPN73_23465 [Paraburkholderia sp.]
MSSLRILVEKWLTPGPGCSLRITRFSCTGSERRRHVRVDARRAGGGTVTILFFRHRDGLWRVFPPEADRLAMRADPIDR